MTPLKIEAIATPDWKESDGFTLTRSVLAMLGFDYAGAFRAVGIADSQACLFINPKASTKNGGNTDNGTGTIELVGSNQLSPQTCVAIDRCGWIPF